MSAARPKRSRAEAENAPTENPPVASGSAEGTTPYLLDFLPRETEGDSRLSQFFARLREGRLSTRRCRADGSLSWPPRLVCPKCHRSDLEWVDLPETGRLYAFSAVLAGAPFGMEADVPFAVGLVDLDGVPLRLFGRVVGRPWSELSIGDRVAVEPYNSDDGRVFYRFRAVLPE